MGEEEQLTKEFECIVKDLECLFSCLSFREKSIGTEWIKRLKKSDANIDELKLRLDFAEYFANCARCGLFGSEPFNRVPAPNEPLVKLGSLLPPEHKVRSLDATSNEQRNIYLNEMFEQIPDGGTFLEDQPVPNEGTFFLLLIKRECGEDV